MRLFRLRQSVLLVALLVLAGGVALRVYLARSSTIRHTDPIEPTHHIKQLGRMLRLYAADHDGRLPSDGCDKLHRRPTWVISLEHWYPTGLGEGRQADWQRILKSPRDSSPEPISYELNPALTGHCMGEVPERERASTPLIYEKRRVGKHRLVYYLDGSCRAE